MKIYIALVGSCCDEHNRGVFTDKRLFVEWLLLFIKSGRGGARDDVYVEIWEPNSNGEPLDSHLFTNQPDPPFGYGCSHDVLTADGAARFLADDRF